MVNNQLDPHDATMRASAGFIFAMIAALAVTIGLYLAIGDGSIERQLVVYGPGVGVILFALRWCWVTIDADRAQLHYQQQREMDVQHEERLARIRVAEEQAMSRVRVEESRAQALLPPPSKPVTDGHTFQINHGKGKRIATLGPMREWLWTLRNGDTARGDIIDGLVQLYGRDGDMRDLLRKELNLQFSNGAPAKAIQALIESGAMHETEEGPEWTISQPEAHTRVDEMYRHAIKPPTAIPNYMGPKSEEVART